MGIPTQIMPTKNVRKRNDEISLTGSVSDDDIEEGRLRNRIKGGGNVKRKSTKKLDVDLGEEKYDKKKSFRGKRIDDDELSVDLLPLLNGGDEESQKAVHDDDYKNYPAPPLTKILRLFRPEWPVCVLGIVLMLITEFTNLYNPAVIAACYELVAGTEQHGTPEERLQKVTSTFVVVLIVHLIGNVSTFFRCSLVGVVSERVVARLRARLYRNLLRQDIAFFDKHNTGDLSSHLTSDTGLLQEAISQALPEIVVGSIKLVGASIAMLWISPSLALVTVGCVGTSIAMSSVFGKWMGKWTRRYYDVYGRAQSHCYEALAAMRLVQSFTAESKEEERFNSFLGSSKGWFPSMRGVPSESMYELGKAKAFVTASFYTFLFFSGFGSIYISTWYGFRTVIDGHLSFGQFTAFQAFMIQVGVTVVNTSRFIGQCLDSQSASARIMYLLERVPQIPTPRRSLRRGISKKTQNRKPPKILLKPHSMQGAIEFKGVHFRYPTRPAVPVLVGVSLSVPANTTVAFVGPSGAGKSTLVSLLQRFYDVSEGSVCIDGIDIRDLDVKWLRSHVGYVQQEPQMFGISIRDNICYGVDRQVDQTELEAVCRKANAHDFIQKWPDGYDTMVGERGVSLSGGQKQRIAIARALLVNPRILLLDEATSALDSESEHLVQEAIDNAVTGRTVVVIAHRLSTIKNADQIVLVDSHKIVDVGTHEVMMQRCKQYRELIKRQSFAHSVDPTLLLDA